MGNETPGCLILTVLKDSFYSVSTHPLTNMNGVDFCPKQSSSYIFPHCETTHGCWDLTAGIHAPASALTKFWLPRMVFILQKWPLCKPSFGVLLWQKKPIYKRVVALFKQWLGPAWGRCPARWLTLKIVPFLDAQVFWMCGQMWRSHAKSGLFWGEWG